MVSSFMISSTAFTLGITGAFVFRSRSKPMRIFMLSFSLVLTALLIALLETPIRHYENEPEVWIYVVAVMTAAIALFYRLKEIMEGRRHRNRRKDDE